MIGTPHRWMNILSQKFSGKIASTKNNRMVHEIMQIMSSYNRQISEVSELVVDAKKVIKINQLINWQSLQQIPNHIGLC